MPCECVAYIAAASMYISVSGKQQWALGGCDGERQTHWSARLRDLRLRGAGGWAPAANLGDHGWMYI